MSGLYSWAWVEAQADETSAAWNSCAGGQTPDAPRYIPREQRRREKAYDEGLEAVERELKKARRSPVPRREIQDRVTAAFARFSAAALDLDDAAIELLTGDFLPAGTQLARWARQFDPSLSMPDIIQAARNAWTACGLQPLLGEHVALTPSILGYSMLYPYSDNYLDGEDATAESKLLFSRRFRERLRGEMVAAASQREAALWALVELIEGQYPRSLYPEVFDCLLAIHQAQENSIAQVRSVSSEAELLRVSCAKGGSSVLADGILARGWLTEEESRVSFEWGVLLQLGDDLQDVCEDMKRGSVTLFSGPAARGQLLDERVIQLLRFSERVSDRMARLPNGTAMLKGLLRMSWRSLILMAVAASHEHFSRRFLREVEQFSPFRFGFLRERRRKLTGRRGLYATLFNAFVEPDGDEHPALPAAAAGKVPDYALLPEIPHA
ncbi:MAG: hypothetical protein WCC27_02225 [Acidobacteriaceae bacterium]